MGLACVVCGVVIILFFSSRSRHTRCALVTGVQTCALPILRLSMRTRINAFVNSTLTKAGYQLRKLPRNDERPLPRDLEPDILEIIRQVRPFPMTSPERLYGLVKAGDYVCQNAIAGDIVECGVGVGGCRVALAARLMEIGRIPRHV